MRDMEIERMEAVAVEMEMEVEVEVPLSPSVKLNDKPLSPTVSESSNSCVSNESSNDFFGTNLPFPSPSPSLDIHIPLHQGTTGFSVHQNGSSGVYSLTESNGGHKEIDASPNGSTFSKSPDTAVGLKYLESLLDDNSSDVVPTGSFNTENEIVSHDETAGVLRAEELEPQLEEYDVERVIQKQETHDLYCPNCHSCITKRVILRRRKRKFQEISTAEEASRPGLDQSGLPAQLSGPPDSRLDAISCFSCFSIFIPSGKGFLCWRFKPKADATRQPDVTSTNVGQVEKSPTDSTGTIFPLWVVTCCQPAERNKPDESHETTTTLGSIHGPISEDDTEVVSRQTEPPLPLSDDVPVPSIAETLVPEHSTGHPYTRGPQHGVGSTLQNKPFSPIKPYGDTPSPSSETPSNITADEGSKFPLWILTCCQPSMVGKKKDYPMKLDESVPAQKNPSAPSGGAKPDHPVMPDHLFNEDGAAPQRETPSSDITEFDLLAKPDGTVLQRENPSAPSDFTKSDHGAKPDGTVLQRENPSAPSDFTKSDHVAKPDGTVLQRENPSAPSDFTESDHVAKPGETVPQRETLSAPSGSTGPPLAPSDDIPIPPFKPAPPAIYVPGTSSPSKLITPVEPNYGIPLPPQTESSASPGNDVLTIPPKPQPPVIPSDTHRAELLVDVEPGVARETRRPGVSGLDVIKAIVYGGLLESITSLSVITSAAGGDATTLNIVALGLANVFGGLVVLVHSLRVLKHEHATEHYEAQLGRPGHYMFHAIVAIISYLVFGLMSPVIYGFSFRKSNNKDYKLATLAAAALACITLLSAGKAYVRNPPKGYIKTVFYYISLGFMVSGIGYVAGDVINTLLKKFGVFDPRAPDNVGVLAAGVMNGGWSSY